MVVNEAFTNQTMLTCIGNKRKLVDDIIDFIEKIRNKLNKEKLNVFDGFTGSTVVARALSSVVSKLHVNDIELYSYLMSKCYLEIPSNEHQEVIKNHIDIMNDLAVNGPYIEDGIISTNYAPKDTEDIQEGERCFYTRENALIIDTLRQYISSEVEEELQVYCLVPLLNRASIHTNTAGVFKGFYKDSDGVGKFGGQGENALTRIMSPIKVDMPIWNTNNEYECFCYNQDINSLVKTLDDDLDVIYLDPPYNQHPYGSNYFMLNLIAENQVPENISSVSGIPPNWKRSAYNKNTDSKESMKELIKESLKKSKYVLLSYNDEGFIKENDWNEILSGYTIEKKEITYDTYKGSRNLKNRSDKVMEIMYLISLPTESSLSSPLSSSPPISSEIETVNNEKESEDKSLLSTPLKKKAKKKKKLVIKENPNPIEEKKNEKKDIDIKNMEGMEYLQQNVDDNSIDLILTDPPYIISHETGMDKHQKLIENNEKNGIKFVKTEKEWELFKKEKKIKNDEKKENYLKYGTIYGKKYAVKTNYGDWDKDFTMDKLHSFIEIYHKKLKKGGTMIMFFDLWKIGELKEIMEMCGFKQFRFIEWIKTNPQPLNSKTNYLTNCREVALLGVKGSKPTFNSEYDNGIYRYPLQGGKNRFHPTQKSVSLFEELIKKHSNPQDIVLDTFLGGGTTALACKNSERKFMGCEISEEYYNKIMKIIL